MSKSGVIDHDIYKAWDILAKHVANSAKEIRRECGGDVLQFLARKGSFDTFMREELLKAEVRS